MVQLAARLQKTYLMKFSTVIEIWRIMQTSYYHDGHERHTLHCVKLLWSCEWLFCLIACDKSEWVDQSLHRKMAVFLTAFLCLLGLPLLCRTDPTGTKCPPVPGREAETCVCQTKEDSMIDLSSIGNTDGTPRFLIILLRVYTASLLLTCHTCSESII